jgi:septation ring formation regulator EzrA
MNQPTWEDFHRLENELREEMRKLREQITEPIQVTRVEVASADVESRLDNHTELLREISQKQDNFATDVEELKIDAKAYTGDAAIFKNKVERVESDVSTIKSDVDTIKTVQNGHSKYFEEHGRRLGQIETSINRIEATQQKQDLVLQEILDRLPPKP